VKELPFGSWPSPISAAMLAQGPVSIGEPSLTDDAVWWVETRPLEQGRSVLVRARLDDLQPDDVTSPGFSVRTQVHEYGGGSYVVHDDVVYFSNWEDQRLYRQPVGGEPEPITIEPSGPRALRYADGRVTRDGRWLVCVRERHEDGSVHNELVALPLDGSEDPHVVASGHDFFSTPRVSPDGTRLAWLSWDHPNLPWDGTELWVADLGSDATVSNPRPVAGGPEESIFQPEWSPDGVLHFASDRTGWWNLYREVDGRVEPVHDPVEVEFGLPQWVFGTSTYGFLEDGRIVAHAASPAHEFLALIDPGAGVVEEIELSTALTAFRSIIAVRGWRVAVVAAGPTLGSRLILVDPRSGFVHVVKEAVHIDLDRRVISHPRHIEFPTEGGLTAFAVYYPPANGEATGPAGERPPLLVLSHGGPTGHVSPELLLSTLFWTSRGFAVVDVNYGGSTGYGRAYRNRLRGEWGLVDVQDCVAAARWLAGQGEVDGDRLAIRGGSAGGYTTLCALAFTDAFSAGASYFGIGDLETFVKDTHKFEARYLDRLVGPYPEAIDLYRARSAGPHADRITCPVILLQGLEDRVVPPSQSEGMFEALRANGVPAAYLPFEGEQHGFRRADTIQRAHEAELSFYGQVFGFEPAGDIEPVKVEGL
jgi:dipeptidyl aminopeptidase/acylaminoacyl peptidase